MSKRRKNGRKNDVIETDDVPLRDQNRGSDNGTGKLLIPQTCKMAFDKSIAVHRTTTENNSFEPILEEGRGRGTEQRGGATPPPVITAKV